METKSRKVITKGGRVTGSYCLKNKELRFCKMKRVLEMGGGDRCTIGMYLIPLNGILNMLDLNYNEVSPHTGQNGHHQKIYKQ